MRERGREQRSPAPLRPPLQPPSVQYTTSVTSVTHRRLSEYRAAGIWARTQRRPRHTRHLYVVSGRLNLVQGPPSRSPQSSRSDLHSPPRRAARCVQAASSCRIVCVCRRAGRAAGAAARRRKSRSDVKCGRVRRGLDHGRGLHITAQQHAKPVGWSEDGRLPLAMPVRKVALCTRVLQVAQYRGRRLPIPLERLLARFEAHRSPQLAVSDELLHLLGEVVHITR